MHAPHPGVSKRQEAKKHSSLLGGGGGDMGVGGGFWDELRVVKKCQELEWLRHKKLAIDLSYWIVQQNLAVKGLARKPHLRLLLFRVVKLVAGVGALPVFIVDGSAPPEKLQARIKRFNRMMHIQPVLLPLPALPPIKRNQRIHLNHRPFWSVRI
jgi:hypothetical protein